MIYLDIRGRLGNQMFQYAYARALMKQTNNKLIINFKSFLKESQGMSQDGWENSLKYFNTTDFKIYDKSIPFYLYATKSNFIQFLSLFLYLFLKKTAKRNKYFNRIKERTHLNLLKKNIYIQDYINLNFQPSLDKNILIKGWFEDPSYFSNVKEELRDEFTPKQLSSYAEHLINEIESTQSICLSIRTFNEIRHNPDWFDKYNVCGKDYYLKAITYFKKNLPNCTFYIFSDDTEWVKKNYNFKGLTVVFCNQFNNSAEAMYVMSKCKNFIISNSTFSWWGQYLSVNNKKIVICPKIWNKISPNSPLINKDWILF